MSGLIAGLAGAGGAASNTGGYYQNAMNNLVNAYGSPAAQTFGSEETAALQPQFKIQDQNLADRLSSMGILNSGSGRNDFSQLTADQSGTLAGAIAPLYQQALGEYGSIDAAMPAAQENAYQNAINSFYNGIGSIGSFFGGGGPNLQTAPAPDPYTPTATPAGVPGAGYGGDWSSDQGSSTVNYGYGPYMGPEDNP